MGILRNVASQKWRIYAWDTTTGLAKTGDAANITGRIRIDDGASAATDDTNPAEASSTNEKGYYDFDLTQAESNGAKLSLVPASATANIQCVACPPVQYTVPQYSSLLSIDSNGRGDIIKVAGTAQTAGDIIGDTNDIQSRLPAALVSGKMDASVGAYQSGQVPVRVVATGTADSGTVAMLVDTERTEGAGYWVGMGIKFTSGSNVGLERLITAFDNTLDQIDFAPDLPNAVGVGDTYELISLTRTDLHLIRGVVAQYKEFASGAYLSVNIEGISNDFFVAASWESMLDGTAGQTLTANLTGNITGNLSGSVGSVTGAINTAAGVITTLDALDTAQDTQHATTQAKTNLIPASPAAVGSAMTLAAASITTASIADGAITSAKFTVAAITGLATGILEQMRQVWRRALKRTHYDKVGNTIKTYDDDGTTVLTTQTATTSDTDEDVGAAT